MYDIEGGLEDVGWCGRCDTLSIVVGGDDGDEPQGDEEENVESDGEGSWVCGFGRNGAEENNGCTVDDWNPLNGKRKDERLLPIRVAKPGVPSGLPGNASRDARRVRHSAVAIVAKWHIQQARVTVYGKHRLLKEQTARDSTARNYVTRKVTLLPQ